MTKKEGGIYASFFLILNLRAEERDFAYTSLNSGSCHFTQLGVWPTAAVVENFLSSLVYTHREQGHLEISGPKI
jgi:hypothetical protein